MARERAADQGGVSIEKTGHRFIWIETLLAGLAIPIILLLDRSVTDPSYLWVVLAPIAIVSVNGFLLVRRTYRVDVALGSTAVAVAVFHTLFGVAATTTTATVVLVVIGSVATLYSRVRRPTYLALYATFLAALAFFWGRDTPSWPLDAFGSVASFVLASYLLGRLMDAEQFSSARLGQYRQVLNRLPIAIFEDDFSALLSEFKRLREAGMSDLRQHLLDNPTEVARLMGLISVLDANESATELFGQHRDTLLGPLKAIEADGRNFDAYLDELEAVWNDQDQIASAALIRSDPDIIGAIRWVARFRENTSTTFVAITDISELVEARDALSNLNRSKDEFVAAISHELRTPLTAVLGFSTELANNPQVTDSEKVDLLHLIVEQSKDMAHIVEDLLVSARADMGALVVAPVVADLPSLVQETVDDLGLRIRIDHAGHVPGYVDPVRFRQIVRNLLTNAQRYGGKKRWIEIIEDPDSASVMVSDDGPGVPPEMAEKIFDSFVTAHEPKAVTASMGLGLSVSRHLAHLMDGSLVYRATDDGSKFILTVPTRKPPDIGAPRSSRSTPPTDIGA